MKYPEYVSGDGAVNDDRLRTMTAAQEPSRFTERGAGKRIAPSRFVCSVI
jgi:hypothetical protein